MAGATTDPQSQNPFGTLFAQANAADNAADAKNTEAQQTVTLPQAQLTYAADKVTPVPQYYNPLTRVPSAPMQSPTLRVPGFQGVQNPFYTPPVSPAPQQVGASQANQLLSQYNTYRQGYADQLAAAKQADQARLDAQMKAYQDAQAAKKAQAQAEAKRQSFMGMFGPFGGGFSAAEGGIAELVKDKE